MRSLLCRGMGNKQSSDKEDAGANVVEAPNGTPSKREKICCELLQTEETYVRGLTTLDRYFRSALMQAGEKEKTISAIFSSVPSILGLHNTQMLPQLQLRCTPTAPAKTRWCVAQVFLDFARYVLSCLFFVFFLRLSKSPRFSRTQDN